MSLFKRKVKFSQFIADLMYFQLNFVESNFENMVILADEYKVLTESDKKDLYSIADFLMLADLTVGCIIHLSNKITNEDIGYVISSIYVKFLNDNRKIGIKEIEKKGEKYLEFLEFFEKYQEQNKKEIESRKQAGGHPVEIKNDAERMQADLCVAFAEYFTDKIATNKQSETKQGRNFAAFKFAMGVVKADFVKLALKECNIIWD